MRQYGEEIASRLKLSKDGKYVLWPQPTDRPEDPQNVSFTVGARRAWLMEGVAVVGFQEDIPLDHHHHGRLRSGFYLELWDRIVVSAGGAV